MNESTAPRKRTWMAGEDRREQILDAALKVFSERGYQETSIEHVCREACIARGTLYQYFADKQTLFRDLIRQRVDRILAHMVPFTRQGLVLPTGRDDVLALLELRIRNIFEVVLRERQTYALLFREAAAKTTGTEDLVRQLDAAMLSLMTEELKAAAQAGHFDVADADFTANFLMGGILKSAQEYVFDAADPRDPAALAATTVRLIGRLLGTPGSG